LGLATNDFLIKYFPDLFDYSFTATMEDELDEVSRGEEPGGRQSKNSTSLRE